MRRNTSNLSAKAGADAVLDGLDDGAENGKRGAESSACWDSCNWRQSTKSRSSLDSDGFAAEDGYCTHCFGSRGQRWQMKSCKSLESCYSPCTV